MLLVLLFCAALCPSLSEGQSVTAPFTTSQRLIHPAAALTRSYRTLSVAADHRVENFKVLNLVNSSITEELKIDQVIGHSSMAFGRGWKAEFDFAFQSGSQEKKNSYYEAGLGSNSQSTKDEVTLIPTQILFARNLTPSLGLGIKGMFLKADVTTRSKYSIDNGQTKFSADQTNTLNGSFMVIGTGFTYRLLNYFYFSYAADFNQFKAEKRINGTSTSDSPGNSDGTETRIVNSTTTRSVRKDIVGISFLKGNPRSNAFRTEVSAERITPLVSGSHLKDGQLIRATMEAQWAYFHLGGEYILREGFMVDTYNLIPYFFKFDEFSNQTKTDYGFFGGLRSSKGHSLGAFFTTSKDKVKEKLSGADANLYEGERSSQAYGLSYSYVF